MKTNRMILIGMIGVIAILLGACSSVSLPLNGADKDKVLAYSEAMTDNLMQSINANDLTPFTRDMNDKLKGAFTTDGFAKMQTQVGGKIGKYVSRQVASVLQQGDNITVIYNAKFENDDPVTIRVVFETAEPHRVTGLWFDSAKLRAQ